LLPGLLHARTHVQNQNHSRFLYGRNGVNLYRLVIDLGAKLIKRDIRNGLSMPIDQTDRRADAACLTVSILCKHRYRNSSDNQERKVSQGLNARFKCCPLGPALAMAISH